MLRLKDASSLADETMNHPSGGSYRYFATSTRTRKVGFVTKT